MKKFYAITGLFVLFAINSLSANWQYRTTVKVTNNKNNTLVNYQVKLLLKSSNFDFSKLAFHDGRDIRFSTDSTGYSTTKLPYWIESWTVDNDSTSLIWIKVDSLFPGGNKIYMFYGDKTATAASDGNATFEFFDDFESNAPSKCFGFNTNTLGPNAYPGWTVITGSWCVENGVLKNFYGGDKIKIDSPANEPAGRANRSKVRETGDWKYPQMILGWQDKDNYYPIIFDGAGDRMKLSKVVNGNGTLLNQQSITLNKSTWYRWELKWPAASKLNGEIWDLNYNSLSSISATSNLQSWNTGDFAFAGSRGAKTDQFDDVLVRKYTTPEPTLNILNTTSSSPQSQGTFRDSIYAAVKNSKSLYRVDPQQPSLNISPIKFIFYPKTVGIDTTKRIFYYTEDSTKPRSAFYFLDWSNNFWSHKKGYKIKINKLDIHPDGSIYAMENSKKLYVLKLVNGSITSLGSVSGIGKNINGDIAFGTDSTLFVLNKNGLFSINIPNLQATFHGKPFWITGNVEPTGLAYSTNGKLYATDNNPGNSNLYAIDPRNGNSTLLGPLGSSIKDLGIMRAKPASPPSQTNTNLTLDPVCDDLWKISNNTSQQISFTWKEVNGTQQNSDIINPNQKIYFYTQGGYPTVLQLLVNNNLVDQDTASQDSCLCGTNASSVVSYHQGQNNQGGAVRSKKSDPANALGGADQDMFALGFSSGSSNSYIILAFDHYVTNYLTLVERTTNKTSYPTEQADVYVSADKISWTYLGKANNEENQTSDLHRSTFSLMGMEIKYVKIVDRTNPQLFTSYSYADAYDITSVCADSALPSSCNSNNEKLFGLSYKNGKVFYNLNKTNGQSTSVTPNINYGTGACAFHPGLNRIYYAEVNSPYRFAYYDLNTGIHHEINSNGLNVMLNKMAVSPDGAIYAMGNNQTLYNIDPYSGKFTKARSLGKHPNLKGGGDIDFAPNGGMYVLAKSGFYRLNQNNWNAKFIGKPNFLNYRSATGLAFAANGTLYATDSRGSQSGFYILDTSNGQTTSIGTINHEINDLTMQKNGQCPPSILAPQYLSLDPVCDGLWKVTNTSSSKIAFNWKVARGSQNGSAIANANQKTFFYTQGSYPTVVKIMVSNQTIDQDTSLQKSCSCGTNAAKVVGYKQGKTNNNRTIRTSKSDPKNALGPPDNDMFALGFSSGNTNPYIILSFEKYVTGLLTVFERTIIRTTYPEEKVDVYVSADQHKWTHVGQATNLENPSSDIHRSTFSLKGLSIKYVKIVDRTDRSLFSGYSYADGFDITAICADSVVNASCTVNDRLYGMGFQSGNIFNRINTNTAQTTQMFSSITYGTGACAYHPGLNRLYYSEVHSPYRVSYYDLSTGTHKEINSNGLNVQLNKMGVSPEGIIYAMGNNQTLYSIEPNTGTISWSHSIGSSPNLKGGGDIAFAPNGGMYILAKSGLYRVNKSNWNLSFIGKANFLNHYQASGMDFGSDGTLYAADSRNSQSRFYTMDTSTGKTTPIGTIQNTVNDLAMVWKSSCLTSQLYGTNGYFPALYAIDKNSGAGQQVTTNLLYGTAALTYQHNLNRMYYMNLFNSPYKVAYYDMQNNTNTVLNPNTGLNLWVIRMDVSPNDSIYFMTDDQRLYTMNSRTGQINLLSNLNGFNGANYNGDIAFAPNGRLFLLCRSGLYAVNLNNYTLDFKGRPSWINSTTYPSGIVFTQDSTLYATDGNPNGSNLYILDTANANSQTVGNIGYQVNDLAVKTTCCTSQNSQSGNSPGTNQHKSSFSPGHWQLSHSSAAGDDSKNVNIEIFPNPVRNGDNLNITFNKNELGEIEKIRVISPAGKALDRHPEKVNDNQLKLNTAGLNAGFYYISIQSSQKRITKSFVIY